MWFFEKVEDIGHDNFLAKRYQSRVPPGRYAIRSCHHASYLRNITGGDGTVFVALELAKNVDKPKDSYPVMLFMLD